MTTSVIGAFETAAGPTDGATVDLWLASRFGGQPAYNAAAPSGVADYGPVTTGTGFGGPGQWVIAGVTDGSYYVRQVYAGNTSWTGPWTIAAGLLLIGGTMSGPIAMGTNAITGLANGSAPQDAAAFGQIPTALPPNGTAGGDLTGSYPNPTVSSTANVRSIIEAIRLDQMATPTADVAWGAKKITGLAAGSAATDAANVSQVQAGQGGGAFVANADTTTSGSYGAFTHAGPAVTITTHTTALVFLTANLVNTGSFYSLMSFAVTGATTLAASNANAVSFFGTGGGQLGAMLFISGLTAGINTITAQGATTGGTATISNRHLSVIPLPV